ncbi:hypothetical protein QQ045_013766 [Rhodiola kirilowii]
MASLRILATILAIILFVQTDPIMAQCGGNVFRVVRQCYRFVKKEGPKVAPSVECCDALKPIDVACACNFFRGFVLDKISPEKTIYVAETCGMEVPHGQKCGDYDVPPAAAARINNHL